MPAEIRTEPHSPFLVSLIAEYSDPSLGAFKRMVQSVVRATIDHNDDFVARRDCFQDISHVLDVFLNASTLSVCWDDNREVNTFPNPGFIITLHDVGYD